MASSILTVPLQIKVRLASNLDHENEVAKEDIHAYKTTSKNRGIVLIINIDDVPGEEPRIGSEIDVLNLNLLFTEMGFSVDIYSSLKYTKQNIINMLKSFVQDKRLESADIAMLFIMGHGNRFENKDYIITVDRQKIFYEDVIMYFSNSKCTKMQEKPKMIFFQMCRGRKIDFGVSHTNDEVHFDAATFSYSNIPNFTDLLIGYATTPGYVACRSEKKGSLFIRLLCEQFMNWAYKRDVTTMLENIYRNLANENISHEYGTLMQCGEYINRTFSKCFLNPGIYRDENGEVRYIFRNNDKVQQLKGLVMHWISEDCSELSRCWF